MDLQKWRTLFETLLDEEGLSEPRQFLEPLDEFDEVPLFTRVSRIAFLDGVEAEERNAILLAAALEYADRVVQLASSTLPHESLVEFFIMVTVLDWERTTITPCFWITTRARDELRNMAVKPAYSVEAQRVEEWLKTLAQDERFVVADYPAPPDDYGLMRVHVAHRHLPRSEMPLLSSLLV